MPLKSKGSKGKGSKGSKGKGSKGKGSKAKGSKGSKGSKAKGSKAKGSKGSKAKGSKRQRTGLSENLFALVKKGLEYGAYVQRYDGTFLTQREIGENIEEAKAKDPNRNTIYIIDPKKITKSLLEKAARAGVFVQHDDGSPKEAAAITAELDAAKFERDPNSMYYDNKRPSRNPLAERAPKPAAVRAGLADFDEDLCSNSGDEEHYLRADITRMEKELRKMGQWPPEGVSSMSRKEKCSELARRLQIKEKLMQNMRTMPQYKETPEREIKAIAETTMRAKAKEAIATMTRATQDIQTSLSVLDRIGTQSQTREAQEVLRQSTPTSAPSTGGIWGRVGGAVSGTVGSVMGALTGSPKSGATARERGALPRRMEEEQEEEEEEDNEGYFTEESEPEVEESDVGSDEETDDDDDDEFFESSQEPSPRRGVFGTMAAMFRGGSAISTPPVSPRRSPRFAGTTAPPATMPNPQIAAPSARGAGGSRRSESSSERSSTSSSSKSSSDDLERWPALSDLHLGKKAWQTKPLQQCTRSIKPNTPEQKTFFTRNILTKEGQKLLNPREKYGNAHERCKAIHSHYPQLFGAAN